MCITNIQATRTSVLPYCVSDVGPESPKPNAHMNL